MLFGNRYRRITKNTVKSSTDIYYFKDKTEWKINNEVRGRDVNF